MNNQVKPKAGLRQRHSFFPRLLQAFGLKIALVGILNRNFPLVDYNGMSNWISWTIYFLIIRRRVRSVCDWIITFTLKIKGMSNWWLVLTLTKHPTVDRDNERSSLWSRFIVRWLNLMESEGVSRKTLKCKCSETPPRNYLHIRSIHH